MLRISTLRAFLAAVLLLAAHIPATAEENPMKIRIVIGDTTLNATLADNPTARDFASLLPLNIELKDYAQTEKISDLPKRLSTSEAPIGSDPAIGDIAYYAPWGNLAIFHQDFSYSKGLVKLGRIDSGIEVLRRAGALTATIELATESAK